MIAGILSYVNWYFNRYTRRFVTLWGHIDSKVYTELTAASVHHFSHQCLVSQCSGEDHLVTGGMLYICHQECTLGFQQNPAVNLSDKLRNWCRQARVCTLGRVVQPNSLLLFCPKEWIRLEYVKPWCCQPPAFCRMLQPDKRPQPDYSYICFILLLCCVFSCLLAPVSFLSLAVRLRY